MVLAQVLEQVCGCRPYPTSARVAVLECIEAKQRLRILQESQVDIMVECIVGTFPEEPAEEKTI